MSQCTCGHHFRDAEDYRDHLPCPGTADYQRGLAEGERRGREGMLASQRDEAIEDAAKVLDAEADKAGDKARIELSQGNHEMVVYHCSIQGSIQHDAELVRALKAKP